MADLQQLGGAALAVIGFLQRLFDLPALDLHDRATRRVGQRTCEINFGPRIRRLGLRLGRLEGQIQVARQQRVAVRENHGALDTVLELAHVAGPSIGDQRLDRRRRQHDCRLLHVAAEPIDEVPRQKRNVTGPVAQGRHGYRKHRQPEEQVLTETSGRDRGTQAAVGRRHEAHVHLDGRCAADALEALLFERAENLGLQRQRQVADLVEKQRAAVGHLELARLSGHRAGERALLVTEELASRAAFPGWPRS